MHAIRKETARTAKGVRRRPPGHATASDTFETSSIASFETIAQRYLDYQRKRLAPDSLKRVRKIIRAHLIPYFGPQRAATTFTEADIATYLSDRSKRVSTVPLAKEFSVIKNIFQKALDSKLIDSNPAIGTLRPKVSAKQNVFRPLTADEVSKILEASPEWLRPIIMVAVLTGLRRNELTGLRWGDLVGEELHVRQTRKLKSRTRERVIPLSKSVKDILLSVRPSRVDPTQPIFACPPATEANISLRFLRASRKAGITQVSFHSLRETGVDAISKAGMGFETISAFLGHSNPLSTVRYLRNGRPDVGAPQIGNAIHAVERALKANKFKD